ncbi:MAG: EscU/YscU/HrcU family type III secretion system export apparatus switch protein [Clostridiales bacterium]|nr:EscU/YscU/HrcU family type III secretion system export apparatus switch protein [Clostridiales bacterium]
MSKYDYENAKLNQKAVALKYDGGDIAPVIVATGMGYTAERIVQSALEHDVPVYEDTSLATLLSRLELGDQIPPELYKLVVDIYVYFLKFSLNNKNNEEEIQKQIDGSTVIKNGQNASNNS